MTDYREAYPYVCLECGRKVDKNRRFFPLDGLLECINLESNGNKINAAEWIKRYFLMGTEFGGSVLGTDEIRRFHSEDSDVSPDQLTQIKYCMEHVVKGIEKQLSLETNSIMRLIVYLVGYDRGWENCGSKLRELAQMMQDEDTASSDENRELCNIIQKAQKEAEPFMNQGKMGNAATRGDTFYEFLDALKTLCAADPALEFEEEEQCGYRTLSQEFREVRIGWIYRVNPYNERMSPKELYIYDCGNKMNPIRECRDACCPYCYQYVPENFGVFRQKIVGVLGGQTTGKTTYLAAFTDFIDSDISEEPYKRLPFTITYDPDQDYQWKRFGIPYDKNNQNLFGPMWAYRHGYNVQKTELSKDSAASLSFLVSPHNGEPVIYVLADIAGEAFENRETGSAAQAAKISKKLLGFCEALFMVMSCDRNDARVTASRYRRWMEDFPDKRIPAALLLTKADSIFKDGECTSYGSALNLKHIRPVVKYGEQAVYNLEMMTSACRLAEKCADKMAAGLMGALKDMMKQKPSVPAANGERDEIALTAFMVSSGTGGYCDYRDDPLLISGGKEGEEAQQERYELAKVERYGIAAPFLWLLVLDGLLPFGRGENEYLKYDTATEKMLTRCMYRELYDPE